MIAFEDSKKILIVDDHAVVRAGVKQFLVDSAKQFEIGEAACGDTAFSLLREQAWDLVLLNIAVPGRNGIQVLKQIKRNWPKLPVLILSMYAEDQYAIRAMRAGAAGYMTRECAPDDLLAAVDKVLAGGHYISTCVTEQLISALDENLDKPLHADLSDREFEVLRLIAMGNSVSEVGKLLSLNVKTISTYRSRILKKMKLHNNAELTHYAIKERLV